MKEVALLLASHGSFAKGALECAEMIIGKQDNCRVISLEVEKNPSDMMEEIYKAYEELDTTQGVLILVDLRGGTPCNLASRLLIEKENILLYAGFNVPVLIEAASRRDTSLEDLSLRIEESFHNSLININQLLKKEE